MNSPDDSILSPKCPVLIVDDNSQYSRILRSMLEHSVGFEEIVTVDSVAAGVALIEEAPERFKLLFVDYNFPDGHNGGAMLTELKSRGLLDHKTAFLITSEPTGENFKQALAAGAKGVVAKPFDSGELRRQLEKAERSRVADSSDDNF